MNVQDKYSAVLILSLCLMASCSQQSEKTAEIPNESVTAVNLDTVELPPPVKAIYIDPDSIKPPTVVPLKHQPKVVPAHPNVHPVGIGKVFQIPKDLKVVTLGKDVPLPESFAAKAKTSPVFQPKPVPALPSRMRDASIYNIQYISKDEGLPFGGISILEDSKGHIWMGNAGKIVRYDGENFFPYTEQEGIFEGFIIMEDSKGHIWFGGPGGLGYYDGKKVAHFKEQEELKNNWWNSILEDSKGNIWLGSDKGVFRFDPDSNREKFTFFKKENGLINNAEKEVGQFFDNRINAILEDSRGHFWWATSGSGVLRYDGKRIIHYTEKEGLIDNYIKSILEDSKGQIWFGSGGENVAEGKGISIYNPDLITDQGLGGTFTNYSTAEGLGGNRITGMVEDDWGNVWMSTFAGGLTCYDGQNFIHYTTEEGLSSNDINSIIIDSKENIWLVLNGGNGMVRFQPNSFRHFTEKQGLSTNWIEEILEDSKGNIWMGTLYGGLLKYDGQSFIHYSEKEDLLKDAANPLLEDKQGNIWIRSRDQGAFYFDGNVLKQPGPEQGFINPYSYHVCQDNQGRIWISTWSNKEEGRSIRYNPNNGQITHFLSDNKQGVTGASIFKDKENNIWFGGKACVAKYDPINDQINYVIQLDVEYPDWLFFLMEDDKDNLWFSMENDTRIFKMNKNGGKPIPIFTKDQGFPYSELRSMTVDNKQNIWFAGQGNGIGVIPSGAEDLDSSSLTWIQYDKKDGLKSINYNSDGIIDSRNRLWVGSSDAGVAMLDLNTFELPTEAPKNLSLTHIDIQQQFIDYSRLADTTYRHTLPNGESLIESFDSVGAFNNYPTSLNLPYHLNHLTFHFSAIDWAAPHKIQYSYKIAGLDNTWSAPSTNSEADYQNLSHGTYTLEIKAIGEAKIWSKPFEYSFTIRPPWWHTWWAYGFYGILFIGGLAIAARIQRKWERDKAMAAAKDKELEQAREIEKAYTELKNTQAQLIHTEKMASLGELTAGIAHEIQNPLNFVNNFSEVSSEILDELKHGPFEKLPEEEKAEANEIIDDLNQNLAKILHHGKRADGIVKGMLLHSRDSTGSKEPTDINALADEYLRLAYHGLRAKDKSFNATIISDFDEDIGDVNIAPQDMGRVILNLLNNALYAVAEKSRQKQNEYQPTVTVSTRRVDKGIEIQVKDNGNGIPQKIVDKIFQPFFSTKPTGQGTGLGLSLSYDIVKAHGGAIAVNCEEGIGTKFIISLPN